MRATIAELRPYVVHGRVAGTGAITSGTGFIVSRVTTGQYTVRLLAPIRGIATIVVSAEWTNGAYAAGQAYIGGLFTVYTSSAAGAAADLNFAFTVTATAVT